MTEAQKTALRGERDRLNHSIGETIRFMESEQYRELDVEDKARVRYQTDAMGSYRHYLELRMARAGIK